MRPQIPIALGAGVISAIVFASATTGEMAVRLVLLALVALPVALAGFAYNARTGLLAASVGTLALGALASMGAGVIFAVAFTLPAAGLIYLTLLNRETAPGQTEWYPVGRVVIAAALIAGTLIAGALLLTGGDMDKLRGAVRKSVDVMIKQGFGGIPGGAPASEADTARLSEIVLQLLPGVSAASWMLMMLACLWLAGRVASTGGQLARPWPDLAAIAYPAGTPILLALALGAGLLLDGVPRLIAFGFAGAIYTAFVLLGLAIIHHNTRGLSWRGPLLAAVYLVLVVVNSGASLLLAMIGLADSFTPLRRPPAGPPSNAT
jgi:Predicted membrane protein (DUF2232)